MGGELLAAHNRVRERAGLRRLEGSPALDTAAGRHAADMAARGRMSHRGSDGASPFRRMTRAGYVYTGAAENVAAGQESTAEVMRDWMRSPGHRRNVLGPYSEVGTGYATDASGTAYWCVTFGTPAVGERPAGRGNVGYP